MTGINILAICSALDNSYLGIKYNDKHYFKIIKSDENYHSLYLISALKKMLNDNNIDLNSFDLVTVNTGPGSFTGIRVALCIAKIIAHKLNKPLVPLDTAEILLNAYNGDYLLMDARKDMYFLAELIDGNSDIKLIQKDKINSCDFMGEFREKRLICDKRCFDNFSQIFSEGEFSALNYNLVCYEDKNLDLSEYMIKLAQTKYVCANDSISNNIKLNSPFNPLLVSANYIQTPPVF